MLIRRAMILDFLNSSDGRNRLRIRGFEDIRDGILEGRKRLEEHVRDTCIIVVLLGAGGRGIERRREIARKLEENWILVLIPEDDFAPDVAPSLTEEAILERADVDLIFVNVESWGSVVEFVQFHNKELIAPKLRVLTLYKYHPLYASSKSYLTDLYLTHLAKYGHVYAYDDGKGRVFPTSEKIIVTLSLRYKQLKALGKI
ncbi:MAG: hypothetical protein ACP5ER_04475 [Candidatus Bathyarchaeales archaeon]